MNDKLTGFLSGESQIIGFLSCEESLIGVLSGESSIIGFLSEKSQLKGLLSVPKRIGDTYTGNYEIYPSFEMQTLQTADKNLTDNIVIHPIPSNYGLITWDGSTLTVS